MQSFQERRAETLIRILDVAPMVLTIASIAFALWLIWTEGLSGPTLVTMPGASLLGGMLVGQQTRPARALTDVASAP
jgi:hypothetical protein